MRALVAVVALALCASHAAAQSGVLFNRPGSGARAAGMANAFIGVSDDGTAASWNPAGLGQLRKPELSLVSTNTRQSFDAEGFRTLDDRAVFTATHPVHSTSYLDFASLAIPVTIARKPVTFQVGWRRVYSLDYSENETLSRLPVSEDGPPPVEFSTNGDLTGSVDLVTIAGAVKLTSRLALGASFNLWRGDWAEDTALSQVPLDGPGPAAFFTSHQTNSIRGESLSLGLLLTYPRWSIGLLRQGELNGDFSADLTAAASDRDSPLGPGHLEGTLRFPQVLGLGVAFRPAPRWTVALDTTWDEWTEALITPGPGTTPPAGNTPVSIFDGLPQDLSATRNTFSANAGAECLFYGANFVVPLRFGAAWEPQGQRSPYTRDPVNIVMLAAGTGYNTNSLKFDAALQYRWASALGSASFDLDVPDVLVPTAVGERSLNEWRLKLSLIIRVTDTEKVMGTLRKIFGS